MNLKRLGIYLNDHLAGSTMGLELARRTEGENRSNPVGRYLATFIPELEQDQATLMEVMATLEIPQDRLKRGGAWVAEKLGRLKLNGSLLRYSPLSRLVELEGLCTASEGRLSMWRTLHRLSEREARLASFDFATLATRAEAQLEALQTLRLRSSDAAFADESMETGAGIPAVSEH